jgi:hypothetical protein
MDNSILESAQAAVVLAGRHRTNLSVMHLLSAASFSRATGQIETAHAGEPFGAFWEDIFGQATAAVMLSVAALEAYAHEFQLDHAKLLSASVGGSFVGSRKGRSRTLGRFDSALGRLKREAIDEASAVDRNAAALIRLRNALTHFNPEWEDERDAQAAVSADLQGRFENSRYFPAPQPLFPMAWATHSCTAWAVHSVVDFISEFDRRADLGEGRLAQFVERLTDV